MIIDLENIICIKCNEKLEKINNITSICKCGYVFFGKETYITYHRLTIDGIYFTFCKSYINIFSNHSCNNEFILIIKDIVNQIDYNNLYCLSQFYNYIIKYIINYEKNLLFK